MAYIARLIDRVRRETLNQDSSFGFYGLSDYHFIDKLNDAQDRLQSVLVPIAPEMFLHTQVISLIANTGSYALDGQVFLGNFGVYVEFSNDGTTQNYRPIPAISLLEFDFDSDDFVRGYCIVDGAVMLSPTPSSAIGKIRVRYVKELYDLNKRIGKVASNNATSITLNIAPTPDYDTVQNETGIFIADYLSVVTDTGVVQNYSISTTAYDTGTRVFTAAVGVGVALTVGSWVVAGQYASTHTEGARNWERYLISYACRAILSREEGNINFADEDPVLQAIESDIMEAAMCLKVQHTNPSLPNRYYR